MKKLRSFLLGLITFGLLLSSCTPANKENTPESTPDNLDDGLVYDVLSSWTPKVTINYNEDLDPQFDEMTPLDPADQDRLASTLFDVPRDSKLNFHFTDSAPEYLSCQNVVKNHTYYIGVKDVVSNTFKSNPPLTTDGNTISLTFDSTFLYGRVYKIELDPDAYLQFENKDPSIQSLIVEMEDDPTEASEYNTCVPKANIPNLDINKVTEEKTEDNQLMSFLYSGTLPQLEKGDIFLVRDGANDTELTMADFYGIYESEEQVDGKTKVYYSEPSGEDIYDDLRLKRLEPMDLSDAEIVATKEYIQDEFRYSSTARGLLAFFAKQGEITDPEELRGIMEHVTLGFDFKWYDNTFTFTFTVGAIKIKLRDNLFLSIVFQYQLVNVYDVDYDVSLKKEWGIPVGIAYKVKCLEESTESFSLLISVDYTKEAPQQDEEEVKSSLVKELYNAKDSKDNFFKKIQDSAEAVKETEGNKTTIPLVRIPISLPAGVIFEVRIDVSFDMTLQAMLLFKKQTKSQNVVFNFSSEGGGDTSEAKRIEGANDWDIYFMGLIEFRLALRLALAWYIAGTYKFFHIEGYGELWITVGLQGSLMATFTSHTDGDVFSGNLSLDFYVMFGVDVGLDIVLAFYHQDVSGTLFKAYIFRIYMSNEIEHYADDTVTRIEMVNKTVDNINNYDMLCFRVWDGVHMMMDTKKYQAGDRQSIIELFGNEILGVQMFTFTPEDESLLKVSQDGEISIPDGTPAEFTTHFTIHISNALSFVRDREIEVYFNAPDAHHIYYQDNIDGHDIGNITDAGRYRPTVEYTLPDPPDKGGYKFLSYQIDLGTYYPGYIIKMPANDVYVTIMWHKIVYYQVYFYDGKGNIIFVDDHVEEQTAAREPDPKIRDQYMEGYKFIGWDKNFSVVNSNLIVRGIYVKVGD